MAWLLVSVFILLLLPGNAGAQTPPFWVQKYSEKGISGCIEFFAGWSDGTTTSVPWVCPTGVTPRKGAATWLGGYPQITEAGCTEYVARWSNGTFTWVPINCPAGVTYYKNEPAQLEPGQRLPIVLDPGSSPHIHLSVTGGKPGNVIAVALVVDAGEFCTIEFTLPNGVPYTGPELKPQYADDDGEVVWSWFLDTTTPTGLAKVKVNCSGETAGASVPIG